MHELMKAIQCELCGSQELVKDGDFFVCVYCKTKYTTEAAKKLFIEITEPVTVTGSIDTTIGESEKERQLKKAETFFKLNQRSELNSTIQFLCDEYPEDWRGWFWRFKCYLHYFSDCLDAYNLDLQIYHYAFSPGIAENYIRKAIEVCPDSEASSLEKKYNECYANIIQLIDSKELFLDYSRAKYYYEFTYSFPNNEWKIFLAKLIDKYASNAATIKQATADYFYNKTLTLTLYSTVYYKGSNYHLASRTFSGEILRDLTHFDGATLYTSNDSIEIKYSTIRNNNSIEYTSACVNTNDFISKLKSANSPSKRNFFSKLLSQ